MRCRVAALDALILILGERIDEEISGRILALWRRVRSLEMQGIVELIPSYASLYCQFDPGIWDQERLCGVLRRELAALKSERGEEGSLHTIPVYYDPESGEDLPRLARERGMRIEELVAVHSAREYRVYTVGFLPGFAYMGRVDERIAAPRLTTPRSRVPKGSVAIANRQCAVYPMESPGGWNLLGRTPLELFDPALEGFSLLRPGDRVRFKPIGREEYLRMGGEL